MNRLIVVVALVALGSCAAPNRATFHLDANFNPPPGQGLAICNAHFAQQSPQWHRCMTSYTEQIGKLSRCLKTVPLPQVNGCMHSGGKR
jgi:hypothetical protein